MIEVDDVLETAVVVGAFLPAQGGEGVEKEAAEQPGARAQLLHHLRGGQIGGLTAQREEGGRGILAGPPAVVDEERDFARGKGVGAG